MAWWGHVRTRGGGGPALQPVRALAAGLQSPEGHTEPGLAPQTAGGRCSQSIQTRCATPSPCPAAAQVTRPPGTATPKSGEDSTEGAGEEAVPRFRRECGSTCTGTGDGETEPGRRPRRRETPTPGGGDRVGRAAPQEATRCLEETSLPPVSHLWCLHAYSSSVPTRSSINTYRRTLITRQV